MMEAGELVHVATNHPTGTPWDFPNGKASTRARMLCLMKTERLKFYVDNQHRLEFAFYFTPQSNSYIIGDSTWFFEKDVNQYTTDNNGSLRGISYDEFEKDIICSKKEPFDPGFNRVFIYQLCGILVARNSTHTMVRLHNNEISVENAIVFSSQSDIDDFIVKEQTRWNNDAIIENAKVHEQIAEFNANQEVERHEREAIERQAAIDTGVVDSAPPSDAEYEKTIVELGYMPGPFDPYWKNKGKSL